MQLYQLFHMKKLLVVLALFSIARPVSAQDMRYVKHTIVTLSSNTMEGRGYVKNGREKAARLIEKTFKDLNLKTFGDAGKYNQDYTFSVNTFPKDVDLKIGKTNLRPGIDFLVNAASPSFRSTGAQKPIRTNLGKVKTTEEWTKLKAGFNSMDIYELDHTDTLCNRLKISPRTLAAELPKSCYIIPQHNKLIWTVATDTIAATILYVADTSMPKRHFWKSNKVAVHVQNEYEPKESSKNIIGYIPGTDVPDSFIVFTAHYDHLGQMGRYAIFPGANDNASGTAFMLGLARYFAGKPQRYSVVFMAFSGEEAGLLGSKYYVAHPVFPLDKISLLVNIDLMGDATDGITLVNAVKQQATFDALTKLNNEKKYLPKILSRDNAPNSDHYPFTQADVPAIFIYANGGKGYYHDVFDKAQELSLNNIDNVAKLLLDFMSLKSKGR